VDAAGGVGVDDGEIESGCAGAGHLAAIGGGGDGSVDGVNLAGEIAVAGSRAAQLIAGGVGDGIVIDQVQAQGSVTGACRYGHGVTRAAAGHGSDGSAGEAGADQ